MITVLLSTVGRLLSSLGVQAQFTYMVNCAAIRERSMYMVSMSYEALIALIAICCGAGYLLGKDIHTKK